MPRLLMLAVLTLGTCVARAGDGWFYLGAGLTSSQVNYAELPAYAAALNDIHNSKSWQVFAGFRPSSLFAVEVNYVELGRHSNTEQIPPSNGSAVSAIGRESDAKAFAGYAVAFLPIPLPGLDVYAKAGIASFSLNDTASYYGYPGVPGVLLDSQAYPDSGAAFTWGTGIQAHAGSMGGRLEYQGYDKANTSVVSLSVYLLLD